MDRDNNHLPPLGGFLDGSHKPELPPGDKMVNFGLDMLKHSGIGMELALFVENNDIDIKIIKGPQETSYVAGEKQVVICLLASNPAQPARFVLLLASAIREIMQEHEGMKTPHHSEPDDIIIEKVHTKQRNRTAYMCAIAYEINELETFKSYHMLEELKNMGYAEDVETFLKNV